MATRTVFSDQNGNEMDIYINKEGYLYIRIGDEDEHISSYITLDKVDVKQLIKVLTNFENEMD